MENENDDLILSFKDDVEIQPIDDSEVPQKIEMPELADDDFLNIDDVQEEEIEEIVLNEDISDIEEFKITLDDEIEPTKYDKAQAANEIGIDVQSFETLFDDFIIEGNIVCTEINNAIEQGNTNAWRQAAIGLKGMSDNMRIHDFTTELESIIHTQSVSEAQEAVDAIRTKLEQISGKKV